MKTGCGTDPTTIMEYSPTTMEYSPRSPWRNDGPVPDPFDNRHNWTWTEFSKPAGKTEKTNGVAKKPQEFLDSAESTPTKETLSADTNVDKAKSNLNEQIQKSLQEYVTKAKIWLDKGLDPGELWVNEFVVAGLTGWSLSKLRSDRSKGRETISYAKRGRKIFYQVKDISAYMEAYKITGNIM